MSPSGSQKEAFSRVAIDAQLDDVGRNLSDGQSVCYEYQLSDGTFADYVLSDRHGRAMVVVEAKRAAFNLQEVTDQGRAYAEQLDEFPLSPSLTARKFCSGAIKTKPTPHPVSTFFKQKHLERRGAKRNVHVDPLTKVCAPPVW